MLYTQTAYSGDVCNNTGRFGATRCHMNGKSLEGSRNSFLLTGITSGFSFEALNSTGTAVSEDIDAVFTSNTLTIDSDTGVSNIDLTGIDLSATQFGLGTIAPAGVLDANGDTDVFFRRFSSASADQAMDIISIRARGSQGTPSTVQSGDFLAKFLAMGRDGSDNEEAGYIALLVDGTPNESATDMPGRWDFATSPDGDDDPVVRMKIYNNGAVNLVPIASPPSSPAAGDMYVDSTAAADELCFYDGAAWQGISSGTDASCA